MKKLIAIAIAMLFMIPAIATADDRVSLSGSYNLFGYDTDDYDYDSSTNDDQAYYYQRFRVATKINAADDITAYFRFDLAEGKWGYNFNGFGASRGLTNTSTAINGSAHSTSGESQLHVDYAWVKVDKEMWSVQVGQQYFGFGNAITDFIPQGIRATVKTPVEIQLFYAKVEEGSDTVRVAANLTDDGTSNEDSDFYGVNLGYAADTWSLNAFYGTLKDDNDMLDKTLFGIQGNLAAAGMDFNAEINIFDGDDDVNAIEYVGTQFFVEARKNISDAWMLALQGFYAEGTNDANEEVLWTLVSLDSFVWTDYGIMDTWLVPFYAMSVDTNAGTQGIQVITDYKVNDLLLLQGSIGYWEPQEEAATDIESLGVLNISAKYTIGTNAWVGLQYNYITPDMAAGVADDEASALMARFSVSF